MSLILDALSRARDGEQAVPDLATRHAVAQSRWNRGHLLLGGALLIALIIIIYLVARGDTQAPVSQATILATAPQLKPALISEPVPAQERELEAEPEVISEAIARDEVNTTESTLSVSAPIAPASVVSMDPAISELYRKSPRVTPDNAADVVAPTGAAKAPALREQEQERDKPSGTAGRGGEEQALDIQALLRKAQSEVEDTRLTEHSAPFIAALSQQKKDAIPTIYYQRHDYSGSAAASQVVLGGRALKVGGRLASGVQVDEILPDSVVLSYKGTQFRLRALNSWVNL